MKELTKKQKIFVLKEMIRYYENISDKFNVERMCILAKGIINHDTDYESYIGPSEMEWIFPELSSLKPKNSGTYNWFDNYEALPRLGYCKKILKLIESK